MKKILLTILTLLIYSNLLISQVNHKIGVFGDFGVTNPYNNSSLTNAPSFSYGIGVKYEIPISGSLFLNNEIAISNRSFIYTGDVKTLDIRPSFEFKSFNKYSSYRYLLGAGPNFNFFLFGDKLYGFQRNNFQPSFGVFIYTGIQLKKLSYKLKYNTSSLAYNSNLLSSPNPNHFVGISLEYRF